MKNNTLMWGLITIIFILLSLFSLVMHNAADRIITLENEVSSLKEDAEVIREDIQIQKDVFSSYLNGTLSKDVGGGE